MGWVPPPKSATFGLVQIDETEQCPVLVEIAPTGTQAKFRLAGLYPTQPTASQALCQI